MYEGSMGAIPVTNSLMVKFNQLQECVRFRVTGHHPCTCTGALVWFSLCAVVVYLPVLKMCEK